MKMPLLIPAAGGLLALVAGVILLGETSTAQDLDLDGVSADELEVRGIILKPPRAGDFPSVDAERAAEVVKVRYGPDARAREVKLARLGRGLGLMKAGQLVWIVNVDPETIEPHLPSGWTGPIETRADGSPDYGKVLFVLIFVDVETGEWLHGSAKYELPEYMR